MPRKKRDAISRLISHLQYRAADAKYMIGILATLQKTEGIRCEIFDKDYVYTKGQYDRVDEDDDDQFYFESGSMKRSEQEFFGNLPAVSIQNLKSLNRLKPREQVLLDQLKKD